MNNFSAVEAKQLKLEGNNSRDYRFAWRWTSLCGAMQRGDAETAYAYARLLCRLIESEVKK